MPITIAPNACTHKKPQGGRRIEGHYRIDMMKGVKIAGNLMLYKVPTVKSGQDLSRRLTNHILIFDRSGSMCSELPGLISDLKGWVRQIPIGDFLSIGYFSGEYGQNDFIIRGLEITKNSYAAIDRVLDGQNYTLSTTCYSEILQESILVMRDMELLSGSDLFSFVFFTDGYPVVSNEKSEIAWVIQHLKTIKNKISSALLVGYGRHYNRGLMSTMTQTVGGLLVHASNLDMFKKNLELFTCGARAANRQLVKLPDVGKPCGVFSVNDNDSVIVYSPENGAIHYETDRTGLVYVLVEDRREGEVAGEVNDTVFYAAALALCQVARADLALDVLGRLGDVRLVGLLQSAFTNEEYGIAENEIREAMVSHAKRFVFGKFEGCAPARNAFCLVDLIFMLESDNHARFYPRHEKFRYQKIGLSPVQEDPELKFVADPETAVVFSPVWHKTRLNLSIGCQIPGRVALKNARKAKTLGLPVVMHTHIFRSYTIVSDGVLNITDPLPLSMGQDSFYKLRENGCIDKHENWQPGVIYMVNLSAIPVINRAIAEDYLSATQLFLMFRRSLELSTQINVLKKLRNELFPDTEANKSEKLSAVFSQAAVDYLASHGITDNGFNPQMERAEPTDWYDSPVVEIKADGLMSIPKLDVVRKAIVAGKPLTPAQKMVADALAIIDMQVMEQSPKVAQKFAINMTIEARKKELSFCRKYIQFAKFAVVLGKRWFSEFSSREENHLEISGTKFSIELGYERIAY